MNDHTVGTYYALFAYVTWGFLPMFWKLLGTTPAQNILANRIVWTFLFCFLIVLLAQKWPKLLLTLRNKKLRIAALGSGLLLGVNWFIFLYAVTTGQVLETSMGYYINPLFSVFLALVFLKEKMTFWQVVAVVLALAGVLIVTFHYGKIPWIALSLAVTFGFYGFIKKKIHLDVSIGLTLEMTVLFPLVILFVWIKKGSGIIGFSFTARHVLLMLTGMVTAIPLLSFAVAAKKIPLARIGFLQYITPTMFFFLATLVFNESFSQVQLTSFILIWIALILYTLSNAPALVRLESILMNNKKFGTS